MGFGRWWRAIGIRGRDTKREDDKGGTEIVKEDYFMAITERKKSTSTMYPLFFVNNSTRTIDSLEVCRPGTRDTGGQKFKRLRPGKCVEEAIFNDWDFDWITERHVYMKAGNETIYLYFYIPKYFIGWKDDWVDTLPVLKRPGWICYPKDMRILSTAP